MHNSTGYVIKQLVHAFSYALSSYGKRAVAMFDHDTKISYQNNHKMDFGSARVVGQEANFHERLFLEAWFSIRDPQSGNDHIAIPEVYKSLARA